MCWRTRGKQTMENFSTLLRGTTVNRTYGTHKNLYIPPMFTSNIWFYLLWSPVKDRVDSEKTIAILGDRRWAQKAKQEGGYEKQNVRI